MCGYIADTRVFNRPDCEDNNLFKKSLLLNYYAQRGEHSSVNGTGEWIGECIGRERPTVCVSKHGGSARINFRSDHARLNMSIILIQQFLM